MLDAEDQEGEERDVDELRRNEQRPEPRRLTRGSCDERWRVMADEHGLPPRAPARAGAQSEATNGARCNPGLLLSQEHMCSLDCGLPYFLLRQPLLKPLDRVLPFKEFRVGDQRCRRGKEDRRGRW